MLVLLAFSFSIKSADNILTSRYFSPILSQLRTAWTHESNVAFGRLGGLTR